MPTRFMRLVKRKMSSFVRKVGLRRSIPNNVLAVAEEQQNDLVGSESIEYISNFSRHEKYGNQDGPGKEAWYEYEADSPFYSFVDTYSFDRHMEKKNCLRENFLAQCSVKPNKRKDVMDWFLTTFRKLKQFQLRPEVLHLAVAIFDRYIQAVKNVPTKNLELVAVASLFVAVKVEDGLSTKVQMKDGVFLTKDKYGHKEIQEMERTVLRALDFHLIIPCSYHFLSRCHLIMKSLELEVFFGMYILEVTLYCYDTCHILPSLQGAAAYFITRVFVSDEKDLTKIWPDILVKHTGYTISDLKPVVQKTCRLIYEVSLEGPNSKVFKKYDSVKYYAVSRFIANSRLILKKMITFKN